MHQGRTATKCAPAQMSREFTWCWRRRFMCSKWRAHTQKL